MSGTGAGDVEPEPPDSTAAMAAALTVLTS
jgi:hypothetical protein